MQYIVQCVCLVLCLCLSHYSFSQVYIGGTYGVSGPFGESEKDEIPELEGDVGYRFYVGNSVSEKFAIEVAYVDLGIYEVATLSGEQNAAELSDELAITGYQLSFVGRWPIRRHFSVYGKLGVFEWSGERSIVLTESPDVVQVVDLSERDASLAVGMDYRFMRRFGATLDINAFRTEDVDNFLAGAGVYYSF